MQDTPNLSPEARAALDNGDVDALLAFHRQTFGGYVMEEGAGDGGDPNGDPNGDGGDPNGGDPNGDPNGGPDGGNGDPGEGDPGDGAEDKRVQRANREAQRYRTQLRESQQQLEQTNRVMQALRKALGVDGGEGDNPEKLLEQANSRTSELETELAELRTRDVVRELAPKHKGDADALLDSRTFARKVAELDPAAGDYRDQVADAIKDAVKQDKRLRADQGSGRGGAELGQGSGEGDVTPEQFARMGYKQRAELFENNPTLYRKLAGR